MHVAEREGGECKGFFFWESRRAGKEGGLGNRQGGKNGGRGRILFFSLNHRLAQETLFSFLHKT